MLATESDRLQYLSALGITQYRARAPLPNAAPSLVLQLSDLAALTAKAAPAATQTDATPTTIQAASSTEPANSPQGQYDRAQALDTVAPQARQPAPASTMQSGASAALSAMNTLSQASDKTPVNTVEIAPATQLTTAETASNDDSNSQPFHCQIALWQQDDLLILADVTQLQAADMQLLKNILTACGRKPQLAAPQQFSWPLAKRRNSAFFEAREHFLGLLDASLAQAPVKQLFSFGAQSLRLLTADHETAAQLTDNDGQQQSLATSLQAINFAHRWPLTALPSLTQMLQQPARYKPLAWQLLQSRIAL